MAIAQVFTATRIPTLQVWFGNILTATSSLIVIDDGFRRAIYEGTFQYNAFGEVFGTLSSYEEFENNALKFRITDINADANDLFNAIQLQANASGLPPSSGPI
ncbi:hypothetical protein [uncultured Roseovarius sp.]|uniref:hypothetical protein n=1 Tax=uncultured Roseovarius sp. TaxID=293344 RepID=UPI0026346D8D|nr:hypothetical protein [uncultured Roseovarius sp.]